MSARAAEIKGIAEHVVISAPMDLYLSLRALSVYSGLSIRSLRSVLEDPARPLPHYRFNGGKILVRQSDYDRWASQFRKIGRTDVDKIVSEVLRAF